MMVSLAETSSSEDMDTEMVIFCSQGGLKVDGYWPQPTHKTFNPKFILSARNTSTGYKAEIEEIANQ